MSSVQPLPSFVEVKPGTSRDLDDVMTVMNAAFDPAFGEAWSRSQCAGILPMTGVELSVVREGGVAAGFSLARNVADEAELLLIAVAPAFQGRGIGQLLVEGFVEAARSRGTRLLHLEVRDGNRAIGLYRRMGFHEVGRRRAYYRGDVRRFDALTFARQETY